MAATNGNQTMITQFFLLGFQDLQHFKVFFLIFLLTLYCVTLTGNGAIIFLVSSNRSLHSPMYFFLSHLSFSDILLTTTIVPKMLWVIHREGDITDLSSCLTQFFFFASCECSECVLLTVMAYDRYVAISKPLWYNSLMNYVICIKLAFASWLAGITVALIDTVSMSILKFCGSNIVDHFYCDLLPLIKRSCSDTTIFEMVILVMCFPMIIFPPVVVTISYVYIVHAILKISSLSGRVKAFSTCSSHLTVVTIFYGTLIGIYFSPSSDKLVTHSKVLSLLYTVVTPMMNPIIYSLRNKDIKEAIKNVSAKWKQKI